MCIILDASAPDFQIFDPLTAALTRGVVKISKGAQSVASRQFYANTSSWSSCVFASSAPR